MSITDELREWWVRKFPVMDKELHKDFSAIADRIDAEHEKCINAMWEDAKSHLSDESLTERGWVRLPKDADGEYIHIGDVVRLGSVKRDLTVLGIGMVDERGHYKGVFVHEGDDYVWYNARFLRHYHAPTVEDVLEDFYRTAKADSDANMGDLYETIAEYAAKLQLREDA